MHFRFSKMCLRFIFHICPSQNASTGQTKNELSQKILLRNVIAPCRAAELTAETTVRGLNNVEQEDLLVRLLIWPADAF